ncbi:MAG: cupin domain-containing protein [Elusimicrobiota bacterium]
MITGPALALALFCAIPARGQTSRAALVHSASKSPWLMSNTLPLGAQYQLIYEDPATHGVELLVRFPSGYKIPPHSHSQTEVIFMVSGKMALGIGRNVSILHPGYYAVIPAKIAHTLKNVGWGSCEFLSSFNGPFDVIGLPSIH